jgi:hypothetical protein
MQLLKHLVTRSKNAACCRWLSNRLSVKKRCLVIAPIKILTKRRRIFIILVQLIILQRFCFMLPNHWSLRFLCILLESLWCFLKTRLLWYYSYTGSIYNIRSTSIRYPLLIVVVDWLIHYLSQSIIYDLHLRLFRAQHCTIYLIFI